METLNLPPKVTQPVPGEQSFSPTAVDREIFGVKPFDWVTRDVSIGDIFPHWNSVSGAKSFPKDEEELQVFIRQLRPHDQKNLIEQFRYVQTERQLLQGIRRLVLPHNLGEKNLFVEVGYFDASELNGRGQNHHQNGAIGFVEPVYVKSDDLEYLFEQTSEQKIPFDPMQFLHTRTSQGMVAVNDAQHIAVRQRFASKNLPFRTEVIREALLLRKKLRDEIRGASQKRKEELTSVIDWWLWEGDPEAAKPDFESAEGTIRLIRNSLDWAFKKSHQILYGGEPKGLWQVTQTAQKVLFDTTFLLKEWGHILLEPIGGLSLKEKISNWWRIEIKKGSKGLKKGEGGWIADWRIGQAMSDYYTQCQEHEDGEERFYRGLLTSMVLAIDTTMQGERMEEVQKHAAKTKDGNYYGLLWKDGIPTMVPLLGTSTDEVMKRQSVDGIVGQVMKESSAQERVRESGFQIHANNDPFRALSLVLANLNYVTPEQRDQKIDEIFAGDFNLARRMKQWRRIIEGAMFSVSLGGDPYTADHVGIVTAGLCQQLIQVHIDTSTCSTDDPLPSVKIYNPHWQFDADGNMNYMVRVFETLDRLLATYRPVPIRKEQPLADMKPEFLIQLGTWWNKLGGLGQTKFLKSLHRFALTSMNRAPIEEASRRMGKQMLETLIETENERRGANQEKPIASSEEHARRIIRKTGVPHEWEEPIISLIEQGSQQHITSSFNFYVMADILREAMLQEYQPGEDFAATLTPVARNRGGKDPYHSERLGVATHGLDKETIRHLKKIWNVLHTTTGVDNIEEKAEEIFSLYSEMGEKETKKQFFDVMMEEIRQIRKGVVQAFRGDSPTMVLAAVAGRERIRKILQTTAKATLAEPASRLAGNPPDQLSCITAAMREKQGIAKNPQGKIIAEMRGFTGAASSSDDDTPVENAQTVTTITEGPNGKTGLSVRIPGRRHMKYPRYGENALAVQERALAVMTLFGMSKADMRTLLSEYQDEYIGYQAHILTGESLEEFTFLKFLMERLGFKKIIPLQPDSSFPSSPQG